jgi:hypothetical protein
MDIPLDYKNKVFDQFEEWCNKHKPNTEHIWFTTERMFIIRTKSSSIIYKDYTEMREGMGQPSQRLLTATERAWRVG